MKGVAFDSWRSVGVAAQAARIHSMRGVDELVLLDIDATPEGRGPDLDLVRELSETCFIPLTVGGGVRTVDDIDALLRNGADKVAICSAAIADPMLIERAASRFGNQAVVIPIDVAYSGMGQAMVVTECGKVRLQGLSPYKWAQAAEGFGAGEILLTTIDREGTLNGYDLDLIKALASAVDIPVVANGGCGTYDHMLQAIKAGAHGVAAGAFFQFTDATPKGAAEYLSQHGIEVRL